MIPKTIHYCWFGRNPLPKSAIKCINSWKKFFPDYEIKQWNEDNFDVNIIPYTKEAYDAKKYAFVSDYARFWILFQYGGIYFDTDVEVIRSMSDIIDRGAFMGIEVEGANGEYPQIAPGLCLGAENGHSVYNAILNHYNQEHFLNEKGKPNNITVVKHNTKVLKENGLQAINGVQEVKGIWIYPKDFFNPLDNNTGILSITQNTRSIHWYSKSWIDNRNKLKEKLSRWVHRKFGVNALAWTRKFRKHN